MPDYANGSPKENSHVPHVISSGILCQNCHIGTTSDGLSIADKALHVNKKYDVQASGVYSGASVSFVYSSATTSIAGSCASISCHGGGSAQWGGIIACQDCHVSSADVDDFSGSFYANGAASKIKGAGEWDTTGHGKTGAYASGNPGASFTVANACLYCHDNGVLHKTTNNPFRLRNIGDAAWGLNGVCQTCHAEGSAGVAVDSVMKNGARKVGATHYGSRHTTAANGGQFCWDCHDPHGDANLFMVQAAVAKTSDAGTGVPFSTVATSFLSFDTGVGYAKSSSPFDGICNVCHTSTAHYTSTSGDGHNENIRCTQCHEHSGRTRTDAFKSSCESCHGYPPAQDTLVGFVVPSSTGSSVAGAHSTHVNTQKIGCSACHANSVGEGATHNNGDFTVTMGFSFFNGIIEGGVYDGQTTVTYNSSNPATTVTNSGLAQCSNIYCHGNYPGSGTKAAPTWNGSAPCGSCHGASNTGTPNSGTHLKHADAAAGHSYPCTLCHKSVLGGTGPAGYTVADKSKHVSGFVDWQFDTTDSKISPASAYSITSGSQAPSDGLARAYGTCSNAYCHSIGQTATGGPLTGATGEYKTTPKWSQDSGISFCGGCHKNGSHHNYGQPAAMDSGSHTKHLDYRFNTLANTRGPSMKCAICHKYDSAGSFNTCNSCHGVLSSAALLSGHVNGIVDVAIDPEFGTVTYNDTTASPGAPGNGFFSCANTYCHSSGTSVATGSIPANTSEVWGAGALSCDACHGNPPSYLNGSPKKNSHSAHAAYSCNKCHVTTTTNGTSIASTINHVNKLYDVSPETASGVTFTYTYSPSGGSCTNISCHSGGSAQWGGTLP
jgi:predicted CxxxxCH...CXXCH cytochrome family protein